MIRALLFSGPDVEQSCVTARADSNLCFTLSNRSLGIVFVLRSIATSDLHLKSQVAFMMMTPLSREDIKLAEVLITVKNLKCLGNPTLLDA
ncbi:hypothetical protein YC2023_017300 [Brassica napus]